jgi:hypothetical protein
MVNSGRVNIATNGSKISVNKEKPRKVRQELDYLCQTFIAVEY